MHTVTCKPRTFAVFAGTILLVTLSTPIWVTAQVEQEQPNSQTNYFVKNLDTLEDTSTVVKCSSNASPVFADTRPGDPDADSSPQYYSGSCAVYPNTYRLSGECVSSNILQGTCMLRWEPKSCPPGLFVSKQDRTYKTCTRHPAYLVAQRRPCY